MNITDIRIRRVYNENRLRALVSLTIDNDFAVHDIKVIAGPQRLFVAMPSRRGDMGEYRDICHPISKRARDEMEKEIIYAYEQYIIDNPVSFEEKEEKRE